MPCRGARRIHGEVDLVAVPRLVVGKRESIRYRVIIRTDVERGLLPVRSGVACVIDTVCEIVQREIFCKNLLRRERNLSRSCPIRHLELECRVPVQHTCRARTGRKCNILEHRTRRRTGIRTPNPLPRCRHEIGVRRRLRDLDRVRHNACACIRRRRNGIGVRARRCHRLRRRA